MGDGVRAGSSWATSRQFALDASDSLDFMEEVIKNLLGRALHIWIWVR
jgi:hypothetical protein